MKKITRVVILPAILFTVVTFTVRSQVMARVEHATFVVAWYNVGKKVLDGQQGIERVDSGWLGTSEVNRVRYDPDRVSIEEMERWLKEAGTYIRTIPVEKE